MNKRRNELHARFPVCVGYALNDAPKGKNVYVKGLDGAVRPEILRVDVHEGACVYRKEIAKP